MRDLFEGNPNLANKRQRAPVVSLPPDDLMALLHAERASLRGRIKPGVRGVTELRIRLKSITHLVMTIENAR